MISIIIPVYNESKAIEDCLLSLEKLEGEKEVIVVDGGSQDDTVKIAGKYARVLEGVKGRSRQMNYGAEESRGEILWFLHADSRVSKRSLKLMEESIDQGFVGGGFKLYFYDLDSFLIRYIAFTSNLRRYVFKLIFGDQGLYVRRDVFERMGGYEELEIMEDFDFSLRLHKEGPVKKLKEKIGSSARRFEEGGVLKTFLFMQKMKYLYLKGVDTEELNRMYKDVR